MLFDKYPFSVIFGDGLGDQFFRVRKQPSSAFLPIGEGVPIYLVTGMID